MRGRVRSNEKTSSFRQSFANSIKEDEKISQCGTIEPDGIVWLNREITLTSRSNRGSQVVPVSKKNEKHYRFPDHIIEFLNQVEKATGRSGNEVMNRIVQHVKERHTNGQLKLSDL